MEIERNPSSPKLNAKAKRLLTELCFRKDDGLKSVNGIFVYSSTTGIEKMIKLLEKDLRLGISKKVFITGGLPPKELAKDLLVKGTTKEADLVLRALHPERFSDVKFFVERKSSNTLENVTETLKNPEFRKCKSLLFVFKSHAAGRGYLTLKKFFKSATILQRTFNTRYKRANKTITRNNWHTFAFGRDRVWGEFLRIKTYGKRGDIEYGLVERIVKEIEEETKEFYVPKDPSGIVVDLASMLPLNASVMDFGAGQGRNAFYLARKGFDVTALELKDSEISVLQEKNAKARRKIKIVQGDIHDFMPKTKYDAVISNTVLHFFTQQETERAIKKMKQSTKDGGYNLITAYTDKNLPEMRPHLFKHNELLKYYKDWEIVVYEEKPTPWFVHPAGTKPRRNHAAYIIAKKLRPSTP